MLNSSSSSSLPWLAPLVIPRNLPAIVNTDKKLELNVSEKKVEVRRRIHERQFLGHDPNRKVAILKWLDLILLAPKESQLGQLLLADVQCPEDESKAVNLLENWLAKKSTSTLSLRASSFAMFVAYLKKYHEGSVPVPLDEALVYHYVDFLEKLGEATYKSSDVCVYA